MFKQFSIFCLICLVSTHMNAQSIFVGADIYEDYYRRLQLTGEIEDNVSFVIRPLNPSYFMDVKDVYDPNYDLKTNKKSTFKTTYKFAKDKGLISLLPLSIIQQYNSHHPEGWNDGAMYPAKGYQNLVRLGFYSKWGPLSVQIKPEFVYASNPDFPGYDSDFVSPLNFSFPDTPHGEMDYPERFGVDPLTEFFLGQSYVRLNWKGMSIGVSNENLWWGPGTRNSLLMTNTAPGFKHITFNTLRPLKTPIGFLEWQLIAGRLEESGYTSGLPDDWRYINAMILSYQPKWVPGLFIGLIRSFTIYHEDLSNGLSDYLPVIIPFQKNSVGGNDENDQRRNQIVSVFMRWLWPKSNAEIYVEYGREDHAWDLRDFSVQASYSSAYIIGFKKLIPLTKYKGSFIQVQVELTQIEKNQITENRDGGSWYEHGQVLHGYTHYGQILGAGIGPGSNLQSINVSWVQELKAIGVQLERYVHNNDFYFEYVKDIRENWVDWSAAAFARWDYKNLIFDLNLKFVSSLNYQWQYYPKLGDPSYFWEGEGWDVFNFQARLGLTYRFN